MTSSDFFIKNKNLVPSVRVHEQSSEAAASLFMVLYMSCTFCACCVPLPCDAISLIGP